jgi:hypothetical protein
MPPLFIIDGYKNLKLIKRIKLDDSMTEDDMKIIGVKDMDEFNSYMEQIGINPKYYYEFSGDRIIAQTDEIETLKHEKNIEKFDDEIKVYPDVDPEKFKVWVEKNKFDLNKFTYETKPLYTYPIQIQYSVLKKYVSSKQPDDDDGIEIKIDDGIVDGGGRIRRSINKKSRKPKRRVRKSRRRRRR